MTAYTADDVKATILRYLATEPIEVAVMEDFLDECMVDEDDTSILKIPAWVRVPTHAITVMLNERPAPPKGN